MLRGVRGPMTGGPQIRPPGQISSDPSVESDQCLSGNDTCAAPLSFQPNKTCFDCLSGCNNCLNYASNTLTNNNPLPGVTPPKGSPLLKQFPWVGPTAPVCPGFQWTGDVDMWDAPAELGLPTCGRLDAALTSAGWTKLPNQADSPPSVPTDGSRNMLALISKPTFGECQGGKYVVGNAGISDPGLGDMHFVRQDADGTWSQKAGNGNVQDTDCAGNKIGTNPWHGDYRLFVDSAGQQQGCDVPPPTGACPLGQPPALGDKCRLPTYEYLPCGYYQAPPQGVTIEGTSVQGVKSTCQSFIGGACGTFQQYYPSSPLPTVDYICPTDKL